MMNFEDIPDINAAIDPDTRAYNPLHPAARAYCEKVSLPMFGEAFAAGKEAAYIEALRMIAEHQIAPPPWLAAAMLRKIKHAERTKPTNDKIFTALVELQRLKAKQAKKRKPTSTAYICQKHMLKIDGEPISNSTLKRWVDEFKSRIGEDCSNDFLKGLAEAWAIAEARRDKLP